MTSSWVLELALWEGLQWIRAEDIGSLREPSWGSNPTGQQQKGPGVLGGWVRLLFMQQLKGFIHEGAFWNRLWKGVWMSKTYLQNLPKRVPRTSLSILTMTQVCSQGVSLLCEHQHREVGRSHTGLGSAFRSCPSCFLFLDRLCISWSPLSLFVNLGQGPPRTPYLKGLL